MTNPQPKADKIPKEAIEIETMPKTFIDSNVVPAINFAWYLGAKGVRSKWVRQAISSPKKVRPRRNGQTR